MKDYAALDVCGKHQAKRFALDWKAGKRGWKELAEEHDVDETWIDAIAEAMKEVQVSEAARREFARITSDAVQA